jgi:hypothetical protein
MGSRNEIQFRNYRKYAADTSITFDDVDDKAEPKTPTEKKP